MNEADKWLTHVIETEDKKKAAHALNTAPPVSKTPMKKIYVAGASKEAARCRAMIDAVKALGYELTLDWLAEIEKAGAANEGLEHPERQRYAIADMEAVVKADILLVLAPDAFSTGAWVELGIALGHNALAADSWGVVRTPPIRIIVSGSETAIAKCIFTSLARNISVQPTAAQADEIILNILGSLR